MPSYFVTKAKEENVDLYYLHATSACFVNYK